MTRSFALAAFAACLFASTAHAAVESRTADSFVVTLEGASALSPREAEARFLDVSKWWSDAHTYSGSAKNLRIDKRAGGCWCERLENGGFVEHMRLVQRLPESRLALDGALGPLSAMGARGMLIVSIADAESGATVTWRYVVTGPGVGAVADAVDAVMAEQFARYLGSPAR